MAMKTKLTEEEVRLGMAADITRRDFVNTALVGAGAALLGTAGCSEAGNAPRSPTPAGPRKYGSLGPEWTGPGGVGDYQESNGDTAEVVNAAHAVRDGFVEEILEGVIDTGEIYDLVVVGGGFAGLSAAYTLFREHGAQKSCLVLDNHPIFGGEAKQNEFAVDGHRLLAPQGSNGFVWPPGPAEQAGLFIATGTRSACPANCHGRTGPTAPTRICVFRRTTSPPWARRKATPPPAFFTETTAVTTPNG